MPVKGPSVAFEGVVLLLPFPLSHFTEFSTCQHPAPQGEGVFCA